MTDPVPVEPPSGQKLIVLKGLEGNTRADELSSAQGALAPYAGGVVVFWWGVWFAVLSVMIYRNIARPLIRRRRS